MERFDLCVIGSGPGGYIAALRAAELGLKTACVEKDPTFGGTCLNVGCIPSKALLQSTENYSLIQNEAKEHAIQCREVTLDFAKLMQRKEETVAGLVKGIEGLFAGQGVTSFRGTATFKDAHTLTLSSGEEVVADHFLLATGSEATPLPFLSFDEKVILSSTGALSLKKIPKKMVVIGAGAIGLELASVYLRLGTEVTVVEMLDMIAPAMDPLISRTLQKILKKQGLTFHLGAKVKEGSVKKNSATLKVETKEGEKQFEADVVLVAIGRRPYSTGLGLDNVGIACDQRGFVHVDEAFRTSQSHIFAIGDLIDGPMLAHRASDEGVVVAEYLAGKKSQINYMAIPNVIYTFPEVASCGLTEPEAKEMGLEVKVGSSAFKANARARCIGETDGVVKVIGDTKNQRLLGVHIVGPHASEMIAAAAVAIDQRATLDALAHLAHAHPTLSETMKEAYTQLNSRFGF